jgi:hypothetical protein
MTHNFPKFVKNTVSILVHTKIVAKTSVHYCYRNVDHYTRLNERDHFLILMIRTDLVSSKHLRLCTAMAANTCKILQMAYTFTLLLCRLVASCMQYCMTKVADGRRQYQSSSGQCAILHAAIGHSV